MRGREIFFRCRAAFVMENSVVHKFYKQLIILVLFASAGAAVLHAADEPAQITLHPSDGEPLTGEIKSTTADGVILKLSEDNYSPRISWARLSQEDLRILQTNRSAAPFVEPFIEVTQREKIQRTEVPIKEVPRLQRPPGHSLLGGIFGSGIGLFLVLVVYAGNLYAAYEISIFRARPVGLVCGVAAVAPFVGPIIFLSLGPQLAAKEPEWRAPAV